jgi:hypothetical protein
LTFDPASVIRSNPIPESEQSPVYLVFNWIADQPGEQFEVIDLLDYSPSHWKGTALARGYLWRTRKADGTRRYWIVRRRTPQPVGLRRLPKRTA